MRGLAREDPDREDVRRVLAGDSSAYREIVRRWQGPLVNLAYRYCRDRGVAEEMAQEAFLRAYRFLDRWRDDASFSTWLFTVAANVYRSKMRKARLPELPLKSASPIPGGNSPAAELEREDTNEAVRRMVCHLPPRYRDAIVLYYFQGMDLAATARSLKLAEGTVKARLHRGREILRRRLATVLRSPRAAEAS